MASQEVIAALDSLHRELEKLEPAIKHVEMAQEVTQMVKSIPTKHVDLLKEIKEKDGNHKKELEELFSKELNLLTAEFKKLGKETEEIQKQTKEEQKYLSELREKAQQLYKAIESVNFPDRLDKIDNNVSGIIVSVQNIQGRLDLVERNINDKINDLNERIKSLIKEVNSNIIEKTNKINNAISVVEEKINESEKNQKTRAYITWLLLIAIMVMIYLKK